MDCEKALLFYSYSKIVVALKKRVAEQFGLRTAALDQGASLRFLRDILILLKLFNHLFCLAFLPCHFLRHFQLF